VVEQEPVASPEQPDDPGAPSTSFVGPRIVGGALLLLGLAVFLLTLEIGRSRGYSPVGPSFVPTIVALGLIVLAIIFLLRTTVRPDTDLGVRAAREERAAHWGTVGLIGAALLAYAFLLGPLGYPLATAVFVPASARVLGSRSPLRDILIGLAIGFVVWFGFTQALGVRLPSGLLDPLLPGGA
jgi:putative tricarboxylic transport membrane protein